VRHNAAARPVVSRTATVEVFLVPLNTLGPYPSPHTAVKDALAALKRGLEQETWSDACEGLHIFRQLLLHSPDVVIDNLPVVTKAIVTEVRALRVMGIALHLCD
jgi:hypothetical protein